MKKIVLFLFAITSSIAFSQTINCIDFCVLSINNIDTVANTLDVTIYNGDTNQVNYPTVVVTDAMGDTVANINNQFYYFAQMDSTTLVHTIPTTLNTIPTGFTGTVYLTDRIWDITCSFAYPMTCTVGIAEQEIATNNVTLFPNPSSDNFNIVIVNNEWNNATISILDYTGKLIEEIKPQSSITTIYRGNMSSGFYFVVTKTPKTSYTNKLIIK